MKKILVSFLPFMALLLLSGCGANVSVDALEQPVGKSNEFVNHFNKDVFEVYTPEDIEDVALYLPKDTTVVRLKMSVSNIEDVIYMKLVDESGFSVDKVLRRVENISALGLEQDGFMYEPSVEKNIVTLQVYVPSIYLYAKSYKPKLIFSFKRNSRSVQESVQLYFMKERYSVSDKNEQKQERPFYSDVKEYCAGGNKINPDFKTQLDRVNSNRADSEFLTEIRILCN